MKTRKMTIKNKIKEYDKQKKKTEEKKGTHNTVHWISTVEYIFVYTLYFSIFFSNEYQLVYFFFSFSYLFVECK